jgi:hypothetical protein
MSSESGLIAYCISKHQYIQFLAVLGLFRSYHTLQISIHLPAEDDVQPTIDRVRAIKDITRPVQRPACTSPSMVLARNFVLH